MSLNKQARKMQAESLKDFPEELRPQLTRLTDKLYIGIDKLKPKQRRLLATDAIGLARRCFSAAVQGDTAQFQIGYAFLGVAGYAVESEREQKEEVGFQEDDGVTELLNIFTELLRIQASVGVPPEELARREETIKRVEARVAAGEDRNTVVKDELAKYDSAKIEVPVASTTQDSDPKVGMYL